MKIAYAVESGSELNRYSRVPHCYNSKTRQINNIKYTPYTAHKQDESEMGILRRRSKDELRFPERESRKQIIPAPTGASVLPVFCLGLRVT